MRSYGYGREGPESYNRAFFTVLMDHGMDSDDIMLEYLDLNRNRDAEYRAKKRELLLHQYVGKQIDLIVAVEQPALSFLLKELQELAPGVPVMAINATIPEGLPTGDRRFLQRTVNLDFKGTLDRALELFPKTRRVVVVTGTADQDLAVKSESMSTAALWQGKVAFEYTDHLSMDEILQKLASLPPHTLVVYRAINSDATGETFVPFDALLRITKVANAPVFGLYNNYLGTTGVVGGSVYHITQEAERAALMALAIINGQMPLNEPVTSLPSEGIPMFDWEQISRWGGDPSRLPPQSVFVNRPNSLWEQHRSTVILAFSVFIALSGLVLILLIENRRRRVAEALARESEALLSESQKIAHLGSWSLDVKANRLVWSDEVYRIFGLQPQEFDATYEAFLETVHPEDRAAVDGAYSNSLQDGKNHYEIEHRIVRKHTGEVRHVHEKCIHRRDSAGTVIRSIGMVYDITERKRGEELVRIRLRLLELSSSLSLEALLQRTLDEIGELAGSPIGFYHFVEDDQKTLSLQAWSTRTEKEFCKTKGRGLHYSVEQAGVWVDCVRERKTVVHNDYAALPHRRGLPEGHAPVIRELVVPIMRSDRIVAIIGIGNKPTDYTDEDVTVVSYLADVAWEIARRKIAEQMLIESEARYRTLFEEAIEGVALADLDTGEIIDCNRSFLDLTGYEPHELIGKPQRMLHPEEDSAVEFSKTFLDHRRKASGAVLVTELVTKSGAIKQVEIKARPCEINGRKIMQASFRDITPELRYRQERETTLRLLQIMNGDSGAHELIRSLTGFIKEWTGCEAVGVRLREGCDFPYFETLGFPPEFVKAENSLCARDAAGAVMTDVTGNPVLECMCGNILQGRFDPALPFFTPRGSFWTNSTSELLANTSEEDRQARTRNRCNGEGYESVALIPLRVGLDTQGLLQINDRKKNRFTPELIGFIESAADQMAMALSQRRSKAALKVSEQRFRDVSEAAGEFIWETDSEGRLTFVSERVESVLGYGPQELLGKSVYAILGAEEVARWRARLEEQLPVGKGFRDVEHPALAQSGSSVWLSTSAVPIFGPEGRVSGLRGATLDITERKNAEETLRESEAQFKAMFELASVGMAQTNPKNGQWLRVNRKMCEITGYSSDELLGMRVPEITHPDDRERDWKAFQNVVEGDSQSYRLEKRYIRKDGAVVWVNVNMTVIRDSAGNPVRTMATIEDIAERKETEEALQKSEENYRNLFENAPVGIFQTNSRGQVLSVNNAMAHMLGFGSPRDVLEHYSNLGEQLYLRPEKRDQFLRRLRQDGHVENFEYEALAANGSKIWLSMNARIKKPFEAESFMIEGFTTDISERIRAEADRTLLAAAVEQAEENVIVTDAHRTILYVNPAFERSSGYPLEELKGKKLRALRSTRHDDAFYVSMKEILDRGEVWVGDIINRGKDGKEFEIEGSISPIRDASGAITHLVGAGRNMSRYRKLERELHQAQKMESVGRLAGGVAHDFNNMLGVIMGHTELALDEIDSDQSAYHDLQDVLKAARRSADLVRQLLAFARKQTISPKVLNINETVESMLKMVRRLIGEDIELLWKPGADIWPVKVDPTQVDQILANLCVNARDAIAGVGKVVIETDNVKLEDAYCREHAGASPGHYVALSLSDSGCGMDQETMGKVFEPFFTTKEVGKGTGLGLATVYGIVKQNNGFIDVHSEPGRGTTFRIYLPRTEMPDAEEQPAAPQKKNLKGNETILLVEDEEAILALGKSILERHGYTVLAARSPGEALTIAQEDLGPIHLLLTDVVMPEMNGKDLRDKIGAVRPGLRCVFMSGYTANVIAHHGILEEGVDFLQKPFSVQTLAEKVREVLDS